MAEFEQPPLFEVDANRPRPKLAARSAAVRFVPYRVTTLRRLCDDCISDIHARGQGVAPYPMRATWKRTTDALLVCNRHKNERTDSGGN